MSDSLYGILGVSRTATPAEIKKAYLKLARKLHPDVNPGDEAAEATFKKVSSAYEVLSDPEKRKLYDEFGEDATRVGFDPEKARAYARWQEQARHTGGACASGGFGFEDVDLGDLFGDAFAGGARRTRREGRQRAPRAGADLAAELEVDLRDAVLGGVQSIALEAPKPCEGCAGEGHVASGAQEPCRVCGGRGRVQVARGPLAFQAPCEVCGGTGVAPGPVCPTCGGQGQRLERVRLDVRIPAGAADGQKLRLRGQGGPGQRGGPAGDLYVTVRVRPHPLFTREGNDLALELPITVGEAALGATVDVPTFAGEVQLKVPPGSQSGRKLRLRGRGVPAAGTRPAGDLYVRLLVKVPEVTSPEGRQALEALERLYREDVRAALHARS